MAEGRFNLKNPSIKRILQETKEMQNNPSDDYLSLPLEDDIFEWQFAIRGPPDTEFEGGIYHGRIQLPPDYPFKPPSFMLLSPNGRFETQTKICLSISQYHPEHWQPSWSVRTALLALIAFMPTKGNGAIGSLELSKEERRALAIKSRQTPPKYGNEERQKLITEIHERMMKSDGKLDSLPSATENGLEVAGKKDDSELEILKNPVLVGNGVGSESAPSSNIIAGMENLSENEGEQVSDLSPTPPELTRASDNNELLEARGVTRPQVRPRPSDDWALTLLAIGLSVAFLALLLNKILKSHGGWLKF